MSVYACLAHLIRTIAPTRSKTVRLHRQRSVYQPRLEALEDRAVPALNLPTDPLLFTPAPEATPLAMHIHASVHIFVDGMPITIPANVANFGTSASPLH